LANRGTYVARFLLFQIGRFYGLEFVGKKGFEGKSCYDGECETGRFSDIDNLPGYRDPVNPGIIRRVILQNTHVRAAPAMRHKTARRL
jgi:hypothetical protein